MLKIQTHIFHCVSSFSEFVKLSLLLFKPPPCSNVLETLMFKPNYIILRKAQIYYIIQIHNHYTNLKRKILKVLSNRCTCVIIKKK